MNALRDLLRQADPVAEEGEWSAGVRTRTRQTVLQFNRESSAEPQRRSVLTILAVALFLVAGLGMAASLMSPGPVDVIAAVRFEVRMAEEAPGDGLRAAVVADSKRTVYLHRDVVVSNGDIAKAEALRSRVDDSYSLVVMFTADGARKMEAATRDRSGQSLALLIDGEVVTCPTIRATISTTAVVDAHYTKAEADRIVAGVLGR
jgi:SecDF, P1 head subdomain